MEARIKKLFHRKKDASSEEPLQRTQMSNAARSSPALRTSLYDTVPAGGPPQTGPYPIKGDNSSAVLQKRISSQRNRGPSDPIAGLSNPSPTSQSNDRSRVIPTMPSPTQNDFYSSAGKINQPNRERRSEGDSRGQQKSFETPHLNDVSDPSLKNKKVISQSNEPQTSDLNIKSFSGQAHGRIQDHDNDFKERSLRDTVPAHTTQPSIAFRASEDVTDHHRNESLYSSAANYSPRSDSSRYEAELLRKKSIPRKQVGIASERQDSRGLSSLPMGQTTSKSNEESLYETSDILKGDNKLSKERKPLASSDIKKSSLESKKLQAKSAEYIIDKSHDDSVYTEVAEAWAPAVIHETIRQDLHHMREEFVTREVHNHDVYHRILPIIDVEVLPPRHFLPVEGGGLVEISAEEVPGRGRNWVIAETASKIPSDQAAPQGANRFSAREFHGEEDDFKRYVTSEGIHTTEETWVHPPDLETGGRDTGQTWPMVFGDRGNPKTGKSKSSRMPSINHSITAGRHG